MPFGWPKCPPYAVVGVVCSDPAPILPNTAQSACSWKIIFCRKIQVFFGNNCSHHMEMLVTQWGWRLGPGHEFHHIFEYSNLIGDMSIFKNRNIKGYKGNPGLAGPAGAPRNPRNIFLRLKMLFLHRKHGFRTGMTHTEENFPGPKKIFFDPGPPPGPPSGPPRSPGAPPGRPSTSGGGCTT